MCLIAFAQRDRSQISNIHLARAHARNDDAWGIMYPENGRVRLIRSTADHAAFLAAWRQTPLKTPIAVHFRYGTSGAMTADMAHPFPILADDDGVQLAVMHNGVLRCVADEGTLSDTAVFIRDVLCPQLEAKPDLVEVEGWRQAMGAILGEDNKLLFMRGDGRAFLVNGWQGKFEKGGVWYSNTYSIAPPVPKTIGLSYASGGSWGHAWNGFNDDGRFAQSPRGDLLCRSYADPLNAIEELPALPSLHYLSETEIYHFVCEATREDVTDAILEMRCGR